MSIRPLPPDVVTQIKSSTTITSLNSAIRGLIRNSLDARASKITISVDYLRGNCSVEDDGVGIAPAEFMPQGGLGKLHFTSKYPAREDIHGKHGAFIASLASLSLLSVTSHHNEFNSHNSIQIRHSEVLARQIPSPPEQRLLTFPHGTRVTVRDLFGLMPVRVKQRAVEAEKGAHVRDWEALRHSIVALLLSWDKPVSLLAREATNQWSLSIRNSEPSQENLQKSKSAISARISKLLYQTQLFDDNSPDIWVPLRASAGSISVDGSVSTCPIANKRLQFISIGIRPVSNEHGSNVLYEEINRIFSNSCFGVVESYSTKDEDGEVTQGDRSKAGQYTGQELKGRKGVDRWPMFYIRIVIEGAGDQSQTHDIDEILDERHGSLAAIMDLLKAVIYEFLKKHHFRPKRMRRKVDEVAGQISKQAKPRRESSRSSSPRTRSAHNTVKESWTGDLATTKLKFQSAREAHSRSASPFDTWTKIKSGKSQYTLVERKSPKETPEAKTESPRVSRSETMESEGELDDVSPLFGSDGDLLRPPFGELNFKRGNHGHGCQPSDQFNSISSNDSIKWTDPITKEILTIDPRTGTVIGSSYNPGPHPRTEAGEGSMLSKKRIRSQTQPSPSESRSEWLGHLLSSWENPIFETTEPRIPVVANEGNDLDRPVQGFGRSCFVLDTSKTKQSIQSRVSKAALRNAHVIAQVDRKFIFAKVTALSDGVPANDISNPSDSLLLIIDQHAADERCRVEELMRNYFETDNCNINDALETGVAKARTELLEKPIVFDISVSDYKQFTQTAKHFEAWAIHYTLSSITQKGNGGPRRLTVTRLPPSIAERCRLEPRLLIELMRKEAWKMEDVTPQPLSKDKSNGNGELHWLARLHGCPQGILDMINSRACRSSIMFNDALSPDECKQLLTRLADCAFPFQCAHGRPSMIPLVDLGNTTIPHIGKPETGISFGKAFKKWSTHRAVSD
ncbi:hypothetical protein F5Y16DRAFT_370015 [Xylariaceae sp. FL0255]|nr:hypothetical protein F5Y16DRAFT_370015 [Xylariaceae sp. FL0255]